MTEFLQRVRFSEIITLIGFLVGCAFVSYVVRSIGYFSILGPEMLWMYLDLNVMQGAVFSIPGVMLLTSIVYLAILLVVSVVNYEEKNGVLTDRVPILLKKTLKFSLILLAYFVLFFFEFLFGKDMYGAKMLVYFGFFMTNLIAIVDSWFNGSKYSLLFTGFLGFLLMYNCLLQLGKMEAFIDLHKVSPRYSVWADDKSYMNVTVMRSSSSYLILKVGNDAVFYDRARIRRVERETTEILGN